MTASLCMDEEPAWMAFEDGQRLLCCAEPQSTTTMVMIILHLISRNHRARKGGSQHAVPNGVTIPVIKIRSQGHTDGGCAVALVSNRINSSGSRGLISSDMESSDGSMEEAERDMLSGRRVKREFEAYT